MSIKNFLGKHKKLIGVLSLMSIILLGLTFSSAGCKESDPPQCKFLGIDVSYGMSDTFYENSGMFFILQLIISIIPLIYILILFWRQK